MVNKIILVGYVGKDPEVRHLDNNLVTARFTLATNERWTKDGALVEHTEWFNVVTWKGLAEKTEKHVRKGSFVYVEGKLRTRSYDDKDGNKRTITEVMADTITFIGAKPESAKSTTQTGALPPVENTELDAEKGGDLPF